MLGITFKKSQWVTGNIVTKCSGGGTRLHLHLQSALNYLVKEPKVDERFDQLERLQGGTHLRWPQAALAASRTIKKMTVRVKKRVT